ncbi:MAG: FecR domain-containing protein [Pedobacter sp.]|nr:FecR domain-containing protein [Pedobacter sp.]
MDQNLTPMNEERLAKYLLGESDPKETQLVADWIQESPENLRELNDFMAILAASKLPVDETLDEEAALERLNLRLANRTSVKKMTPIYRMVAILAIVFSAGWFLYHNTVANQLSARTSGQTLVQELPDGSSVILNKQTSLSFIGGFFRKTRHVNLSGEAFFKVSKDKAKPFIIDVADVRVTVVGTSFNVKSHKKEVTVNVESGIVMVQNQKGSVRLTAGEKVDIRDGHLIKGETKGKLYNYYYTNELVCDQTPLRDLVSILNEKFGANIIITNPAVESLPISTTFGDESLHEILDVASKTLKIRVVYGTGIIKIQ